MKVWRRRRTAIIGAALIATGAGVLAGILAGSGSSQDTVILPHASCGAAFTRNLGADDPKTWFYGARAVACFGAAARHCKAASILVIEQGTDFGSESVFSVRPGGTPCEVTEQSKFQGLVSSGYATTSCRLAAVTADGVTLGCGALDLLIPAAITPRKPTP